MIKNTIVLVPFPFDDFSITKVRAALCLTDTIGKYEHIIIAFVSSKIPTDLNPTDLLINKKSKNSIGTGLITDSVIRLHKVVTIPKYLIKRKLGMINYSIEAIVKEKLRLLFDQ